MAPGALSLQTISHVAERPLVCVRAPRESQGLLGAILLLAGVRRKHQRPEWIPDQIEKKHFSRWAIQPKWLFIHY